MEKVWIYQSSRPLAADEQNEIRDAAQVFVRSWAAHNHKLKATAAVQYGRFLILAVDQNEVMASGCSIDESVRFVKAIEKKYDLSFFDRHQMAYLKDGEVKTCTLNQIADLFKEGELDEQTLIFNNTVQDRDSMQHAWQQPFIESGFASFR